MPIRAEKKNPRNTESGVMTVAHPAIAETKNETPTPETTPMAPPMILITRASTRNWASRSRRLAPRA